MPRVEGPFVQYLKVGQAVFLVRGDSRSFIHVWVDGNKILGGRLMIRIRSVLRWITCRLVRIRLVFVLPMTISMNMVVKWMSTSRF